MPHGGADLHSELVEQAQHGEYPAELTLWEISELIWLGGDHQADPTGHSGGVGRACRVGHVLSASYVPGFNGRPGVLSCPR